MKRAAGETHRVESAADGATTGRHTKKKSSLSHRGHRVHGEVRFLASVLSVLSVAKSRWGSFVFSFVEKVFFSGACS